ncbi:MAG: ABC-F family ATP-binding cassette domain-containing protein [Acidimicrobiaceae bacterium]|nr:ABC-F family ATP-binding cassette domain-containing protein [Acidimicrobiaceae bacterium]
MLIADSLSVEVGGKFIVANVNFRVNPGEKVGIVGRNGAGKTSLLRVLGGDSEPSGGKVARIGDVGYLNQEPKADFEAAEMSVVQRVISGKGLDEVASALEKLRVAISEDPSELNIRRFSKMEEKFSHLGGYQAEAEAKRILTGLGLSANRFDMQVANLSGGERRRVELARILFAGSDLLLLDEPTNHLDLDAKTWLLSFMRTYRGALIVVSHDLNLLDEAITRIFHLERGQGDGSLTEYKGTFSQYKVAREQDRIRADKEAARLSTEIVRLETLADSMRHQTAKRARVAKTLDRRVERLGERVVERADDYRAKVSTRLKDPPTSGRDVLSVASLCKGFGGNGVFEDVNFDVRRGERWLVVGLNGAGKTTLLKLITGEVPADLGSVRLGHNVSMGYYAQEHENLDRDKTPFELIREVADGTHTELRSALASFGLAGDVIFQPSQTLSGGEKTKLSLAMQVWGEHNLLLLDEPTNNLDPESRVAVGQALSGWKGTMIVVTHDEEFAAELEPDRVLIMPDGTIDYYDDGYLELIAMA